MCAQMYAGTCAQEHTQMQACAYAQAHGPDLYIEDVLWHVYMQAEAGGCTQHTGPCRGPGSLLGFESLRCPLLAGILCGVTSW